MTPVKKTAKQAEDVKVEAAKTEAPAAEAQAEKAAAPAKKTTKKTKAEPAKKTAPAKKAAKKAAAPAKEAEKKAAAPEAAVTIEFQDKQYLAKAILDKAIAAYKADHTSEIRTIELYIKPEEGVAYYVVNGEGSGDFKVEL